ncbi:MAG: 50S ribosomal protein L18 [bacterium]
MATKLEKSKQAHQRRKMRVRKSISGTSDRPRLVVNRSLRYMAVSLVDDSHGVTLLGANSRTEKLDVYESPKDGDSFEIGGKKLPMTRRISDAYKLGQAVAAKAQEKGIKAVVFDRNGLRYHGRVRAVAEGARKGGLEL